MEVVFFSFLSSFQANQQIRTEVQIVPIKDFSGFVCCAPERRVCCYCCVICLWLIGWFKSSSGWMNEFFFTWRDSSLLIQICISRYAAVVECRSSLLRYWDQPMITPSSFSPTFHPAARCWTETLSRHCPLSGRGRWRTAKRWNHLKLENHNKCLMCFCVSGCWALCLPPCSTAQLNISSTSQTW